MKVVINALQYKRNSSGIGVMIRELFGKYTHCTERKVQSVLCADAPEFESSADTEIVNIPHKYGESIKRIFYQAFMFGRKHCKNSVLLTTDSKVPFFVPKSCIVVPVITDLAVFRMPEVYKFSRVLLWKLQYGYVKRRADYFCAISEFTKSEIVKILGISEEKIFVVPCACTQTMKRENDAAKIQAIKAKYGLPDEYVLFVGNTNPRKNLERTIKAFDAVKEKADIPHKLVIVGEQGWKFDKEETLKDIKNKDSILFTGFAPDEDMTALYSGASLFMFTTLYEGFGIPVIEAQSCGTPVITSNCSSLPEVGGDGAMYVDPMDVEEIEKAIAKVLCDGSVAERLVINGYENAKRFSWEKSAHILNQVIEGEILS